MKSLLLRFLWYTFYGFLSRGLHLRPRSKILTSTEEKSVPYFYRGEVSSVLLQRRRQFCTSTKETEAVSLSSLPSRSSSPNPITSLDRANSGNCNKTRCDGRQRQRQRIVIRWPVVGWFSFAWLGGTSKSSARRQIQNRRQASIQISMSNSHSK